MSKVVDVALDQDEGGCALLLARNPKNRALLAELLEDQGIEVAGSADLAGARKQLAAADPDLALVDVSGLTPEVWEVCAELVEAGASVVVVVQSRTERVEEATLRAGVHSVLEKPLRKANLAAMIRSLTE